MVTLASLFFLLLSSIPPKIQVVFNFKLTSSGNIISIPPKILVAVITISFLRLLFLKSSSKPPKIALTSAPRIGFSTTTFCPVKTASHFKVSLSVLFISLTFS